MNWKKHTCALPWRVYIMLSEVTLVGLSLTACGEISDHSASLTSVANASANSAVSVSLIGCCSISGAGRQLLGEQNRESDSCREITLYSYHCELKMTVGSSFIARSWNCWLSAGLLTQQVALLWKAFLPWWKTQGSDGTVFVRVLPYNQWSPFSPQFFT